MSVMMALTIDFFLSFSAAEEGAHMQSLCSGKTDRQTDREIVHYQEQE